MEKLPTGIALLALSSPAFGNLPFEFLTLIQFFDRACVA